MVLGVRDARGIVCDYSYNQTWYHKDRPQVCVPVFFRAVLFSDPRV